MDRRDSARPAAVAGGAVWVPAGADRAGPARKIWGIIPLAVKVSTADTGGALLVFEHRDMPAGGPPRHVHHDQDEWFHVLRGAFAFEVGDVPYRLGPGDSLLAPRRVPHAWACLAGEPGTILIAMQPPRTFEAFLDEQASLDAPPSPEAMAAAFAAHGMTVVGGPLTIG